MSRRLTSDWARTPSYPIQSPLRSPISILGQAFSLFSSHLTQTGRSSFARVKNLPSVKPPPHSYTVIR